MEDPPCWLDSDHWPLTHYWLSRSEWPASSIGGDYCIEILHKACLTIRSLAVKSGVRPGVSRIKLACWLYFYPSHSNLHSPSLFFEFLDAFMGQALSYFGYFFKRSTSSWKFGEEDERTLWPESGGIESMITSSPEVGSYLLFRV